MSSDQEITNIYDVLKYHGINTIIYDVNILMPGSITVHEGYDKSVGASVSRYTHSDYNSLVEYAKKLFNKLRKEMNIVIMVNIHVTGISSISEWIIEDKAAIEINSKHKPTIIYKINNTHRKNIISAIKELHVLNSNDETNLEIIYNIEFNHGPHSTFYFENICKSSISNLATKYNIFDHEICIIKNIYTSSPDLKKNCILLRDFIKNGKMYVYKYIFHHVKKHNFTNDSSGRYTNRGEKTGIEYLDTGEVCVTIDEKMMLQPEFIKCMSPKYIIVLTNDKDKVRREGNKSYRMTQ